MQIKLLLFLLFISSLKSSAFQSDFATAVIIVAASDEVDEFVANRPYGYCHLDGLSMELCGKVSIDLAGATFKKYGMRTDLPQVTNAETLAEWVNNYHLGYDHVDYDLPTAGQLKYMLKNRIYTAGSGCFWIKTNKGYIIAAYNKKCGSTGSYNRLVTADFPSECPESEWTECGLGYRSFELRLSRGNGVDKAGNPNSKPAFRIEYDAYPPQAWGHIQIVSIKQNQTITKVLDKGITDLLVKVTFGGYVVHTFEKLDQVADVTCFRFYMNFETPGPKGYDHWIYEMEPC